MASLFGTKSRGRPSRNDLPIPPHILKALKLRNTGMQWKDAAKEVDIEARTLREYIRENPMFEQILEEYVEEYLAEANNIFVSKVAQVNQRIIDIALDPKTKAYNVIEAGKTIHAAIQNGVINRKNSEQIEELKEAVYAIEGGKVVDV